MKRCTKTDAVGRFLFSGFGGTTAAVRIGSWRQRASLLLGCVLVLLVPIVPVAATATSTLDRPTHAIFLRSILQTLFSRLRHFHALRVPAQEVLGD